MENKPGDLEGLSESSVKLMDAEIKAASVAPPTTTPIAQVVEDKSEDVPDPDEDDLDDLDDMLDEFVPTKSVPTQARVASGLETSNSTTGTSGADDDMSEDAFAKQLQAGMADLLGELGNDPDMKAQFEAMMKELGSGGGLENLTDTGRAPSGTKSQPAANAAKSGPSGAASEESFQETIKKTMERMQASGDKATAAATEDDGDDILAELMKQMGSGALGGEGSEEDFSKMLLGMMEQLTNKEILYEPMKELDDKFPDWMKDNKDKTAKDDMARYEEQAKVVREIVLKFEEKGYSDSNTAAREYIVDRMQKMQAAGSPPPDLVGDMAAAQEAFGVPGGIDEGCAQQ